VKVHDGYNWRASEASETHSDVTRRYSIIYIFIYGTCVLNFDRTLIECGPLKLWKWAEFSANHFVEYSIARDNMTRLLYPN